MNNGNSSTSRSRTLLFISYRDSLSRGSTSATQQNSAIRRGGYSQLQGSEDEEALIGTSAKGKFRRKGKRNAGLNPDVLPPRWVDTSDEIETILSSLPAKISALDKLHAKHVLPGFSDRSAEEREIQRHTAQLTTEFKHCQSLIQEINVTRSAAVSDVHRAMALNVQKGLAGRVQEITSSFRKKQRIYMEKLQGNSFKAYELPRGSSTGADSLASAEDDISSSSYQIQSQQLQLIEDGSSSSQAMLNARDKEIAHIAQSINDLATIFKDLNEMVIDQGTLLDRIDYNIESAVQNIKSAGNELVVATKYQKRSSKRTCIFLLLLIIVGLLLVLINKPSHRSAPSLSDEKPPNPFADPEHAVQEHDNPLDDFR